MIAKRMVPRPVRAAIKGALQSRSLQMGQAGQDLWVIGEVFNERRGGYFVDVGAHDGVELSNTYLLEKKYGWDGVCIEANPDSFVSLRASRSVHCVHACADAAGGTVAFSKKGMHGGIVEDGERCNGEVVQVKAETLDAILESCGAPKRIDYVSVDVEGAEDRVFEGFDLGAHAVTCMTIERPSDTLRSKLRASGFEVVRDIPGLDAFFLHQDFMDEYLQNVFGYYKKRHLALRWK